MQLTKQAVRRNLWPVFLLAIAVGFSLCLAKPAFAISAGVPSQWLDAVQNNGLGQIGNTDFGTNKPKDIRTITANLVNVFLGLLGTIFICLMIAAGVMWTTSAGSPDKVAKARDLMVAGTIGLLIVLAAFAISLYITSRAIYTTQQGMLGPNVNEPVNSDNNKINDYNRRLY